MSTLSSHPNAKTTPASPLCIKPVPSTNPHETTRPLTPPPSEPLGAPATPVVLDTESKTAKIIAEIKAKAYAVASSSGDEDASLEFHDLESSSSSDSDDNPFDSKGKTNA